MLCAINFLNDMYVSTSNGRIKCVGNDVAVNTSQPYTKP